MMKEADRLNLCKALPGSESGVTKMMQAESPTLDEQS
jgi:hypothetical protein